MKYLFIFLPFFAFGQDTIVRGPDTMIIGRSYYHNPSFYKEWARVGKHKDTPGGDSTLYGVRFDSIITHDNFLATPNSSGFLARPNLPNYLSGDIRVSGDSVFRFSKPGWIPCDQHIGKSESYQREKTDTSEVKLLVWTGCSLSEEGATKYLLYNEMQVAKNTGGLAVYITETIKVDVIARYVSDGKWIKPSHIIKEL